MLPVGSPATGDDFVDRERETAFILNTIANDHVMLVAPRRFGKTSIMRKIERDLASKGQSCVFLEVESVNSPAEFHHRSRHGARRVRGGEPRSPDRLGARQSVCPGAGEYRRA